MCRGSRACAALRKSKELNPELLKIICRYCSILRICTSPTQPKSLCCSRNTLRSFFPAGLNSWLVIWFVSYSQVWNSALILALELGAFHKMTMKKMYQSESVSGNQKKGQTVPEFELRGAWGTCTQGLIVKASGLWLSGAVAVQMCVAACWTSARCNSWLVVEEILAFFHFMFTIEKEGKESELWGAFPGVALGRSLPEGV